MPEEYLVEEAFLRHDLWRALAALKRELDQSLGEDAAQDQNIGHEPLRRVFLLVPVRPVGQQASQLFRVEGLVTDEEDLEAHEGEGSRHYEPAERSEVVDLNGEAVRIYLVSLYTTLSVISWEQSRLFPLKAVRIELEDASVLGDDTLDVFGSSLGYFGFYLYRDG